MVDILYCPGCKNVKEDALSCNSVLLTGGESKQEVQVVQIQLSDDRELGARRPVCVTSTMEQRNDLTLLSTVRYLEDGMLPGDVTQVNKLISKLLFWLTYRRSSCKNSMGGV